MEWSDVSRVIGSAAPVVGSILGGPAGGAVGSMIASALGVSNKPDAVAEHLKNNPEALEKIKRLEMEHERELKRMAIEAETTKLAEVNKTMRAELEAESGYRAGWRPFFGYVFATSYGVAMFGATYVIVAEPQHAAPVITAFAQLTPLWGIALAVLGVAIHKRSEDKKLRAGALRNAPSLWDSLKQRIAGGGSGGQGAGGSGSGGDGGRPAPPVKPVQAQDLG